MNGPARVALLLLCLLVAGLAVGAGGLSTAGGSGSQPAPILHPAVANGTAQVSQTSTAQTHFDAVGRFWHNQTVTLQQRSVTGDTSVQTNQSNAVSFTANLTDSYSSISSFSFTLVVSAGAYTPQISITQGGKSILNDTIFATVTIYPNASANRTLIVKIPALYNVTGAGAPIGAYVIYENVTEDFSFTYLSQTSWSGSSSGTYSLSYHFASTSPWWTNTTQVYLPFATGIAVNYTSVRATGGTYQVVQGGVYIQNPTLAPGKGTWDNATYTPPPVTYGPSVVVVLTQARLIAGSATLYTGFGNWTSTYTVPYMGQFVLQVRFGNYTLDPSSVTVRENNRTLLTSGFTVSGSYVTVFAGNVYVTPAGVASWQVNFTSLSAPAQLSISPGQVVAVFGTTEITVANLIEASMGIVLLYAAFAYSIHRHEGRRKVRSIMVDLVVVEAVLLALWVVLSVYGGSPVG